MVEEPQELITELLAAKEAFFADRTPANSARVEVASRAIMDWRNSPASGRGAGITFGDDVKVGD